MRTTSSFSDYEPLGRFGRLPVYVTTLIAALYVVGMLLTTMLGAAHFSVPGLAFSTETFFFRGWLWQPFTCTFLNGPDFFFLFGVFFFYSAGIEVERYLGRARFLKFYLLCLLVVPAVLGLWRLTGIIPGPYGGMREITVAMFLAFATLYPNIEYWGWVPLKYFAFACFAIAALGYFPAGDWIGLSVLVGESALAFGFVRYLQHGGSLEWPDLKEKLFGPRRNFTVLPDPPRTASSSLGGQHSAIDEIDPLLDKIAKSGLASLTRQERAQLEKARQALMNKDPGHR
jgi:membrane associated rhomboid family serine protease